MVFCYDNMSYGAPSDAGRRRSCSGTPPAPPGGRGSSVVLGSSGTVRDLLNDMTSMKRLANASVLQGDGLQRDRLQRDHLEEDRLRRPASRAQSRSVRAAAGAERPRDFTRIARRLERGEIVSDRAFDEVYPLPVRQRSRLYWTPVEIAVRAAQMLAHEPGSTILDIGAGVGKFCLVAAAAVRSEVRGIEHRAHLVDVARAAAAKLGVTPSFEHGSLDRLDMSGIGGVYLYNPFSENLCSPAERLDASVELSEHRFRKDVAATELLLDRARVGTRVVTYCGFGGEMPDGYALIARERQGQLELWVKDRLARCLPRDSAFGAFTSVLVKERRG